MRLEADGERRRAYPASPIAKPRDQSTMAAMDSIEIPNRDDAAPERFWRRLAPVEFHARRAPGWFAFDPETV